MRSALEIRLVHGCGKLHAQLVSESLGEVGILHHAKSKIQTGRPLTCSASVPMSSPNSLSGRGTGSIRESARVKEAREAPETGSGKSGSARVWTRHRVARW